ncbi:hypothetical protein TNIN_420051 [Trichonephila inaurata madagascariensis]|uniref:Uncharacterized protein n=1 Tax=Trichonephila inaurata madagascariensis TaxID=2747483 RepID=A0A8X6KJ38_9ARAC|nr:hypothetical protein TNIN_420051 [Trichonephila inaurata madagascariensis]
MNKFWELDSVPCAKPLTSLEEACEDHFVVARNCNNLSNLGMTSAEKVLSKQVLEFGSSLNNIICIKSVSEVGLGPNFLFPIPIQILSTTNRKETHSTATSNKIAPSHHNPVPHRTCGCLRQPSLHHLDNTQSSSITILTAPHPSTNQEASLHPATTAKD